MRLHEQIGNYSYFMGSVLYTAGSFLFLLRSDHEYETYGTYFYFIGSILFVAGSISNILAMRFQ